MEATPHSFDSETSALVARRVKAQFRRCWRNAAMAVSHLGAKAMYVEGWVVIDHRDPYVIEHGWCESEGRIVDPSYTPYVSNFAPPVAYFPGIRLSVKQAETALCKAQLPVVWARDHQSHERAFRLAWSDAARRRAFRSDPPTRVVHCRREPFDVFVGRPSKWAIPLNLERDGTREVVIERYRKWLIRRPDLLHDVWHLQGKVLGCGCPPYACHGDVLAELANTAGGEDGLRTGTLD